MKWDEEKIYSDSDNYFHELMNEIDQAKDLITVQIYIFNPDQLGLMIYHKLYAAALRGVRVLILVDGIGSYRFESVLSSSPLHPRLICKYFNPLPFQSSLSFDDKFFGFKNWMIKLIKINKRNHRKIITIDQQLTFSGSINFSHVHSYQYSSLKNPWKDIGIKFSGKKLNQLMVWEFLRLWNKKEAKAFRRKMKDKLIPLPEIRINRGIYHRRKIINNFIKSITQTQTRLWIATAYFLPKRKILKEIKKALLKNVDVRIIVSEKSDIFFYHYIQNFWFQDLIRLGAKIYLYQPSILHTKIYLFDETVQLGSTNLNHRSFMHDLEIDFQLNKTESIKTIESYLEDLLVNCKSVDQQYLDQAPFWIQWLTRIFYMIRYWS
jgi:cardiolipin synthase